MEKYHMKIDQKIIRRYEGERRRNEKVKMATTDESTKVHEYRKKETLQKVYKVPTMITSNQNRNNDRFCMGSIEPFLFPI